MERQKAKIINQPLKRVSGFKLLPFALFFLPLVLIFPLSLQAAPKSDLNEVRGRIETLKKEVKNAEGTRDEASDALKKSELAISKMSRNLHELEQQQQDTKSELDKLGGQSEQTQGSISTLQEQLSQLLYQQYLHGQQDPLVAMLNQQDASQIARQLHYYTYIARARAEMIQSLKKNLTNLQHITLRTQEKNAELVRIKEEQSNQKRLLLAEQGTRKKVLEDIAKQIAGQRKEITRLQQDEKRLTNLIQQLAKAAAKAKAAAAAKQVKKPSETKLTNNKIPDASLANSSFRQLKGKMHLPTIGELSNRFGTPREDSGSSWKGLFIRAQSGQAVKAVASGRVVFADWLRGFGNLIIVDHDNSFMSLYGNNESLYKQAGDTVKAGDNIATVGNSGGNPQPGLYFELRYQSKPFDPLTWTR